MNTDLSERVIIVSGATGGLGQEAVRQFASLGARLALLSSSGEKLEQMALALKLPSERTLLLAGDLRDASAVQTTAQAVQARFGRADVLLHLVGGWTGGTSLAELPADELSQMISQHVWTTFYLVQAFTPQMAANGWGRVIVVSSPVVTHPLAKMAAYAAGKAAQEALILTLAQELKGSGVTANILQVRTIDVKHEKVASPKPQNANWSTPEEIMASVMYLCSDEAGMVNGARLPLFG